MAEIIRFALGNFTLTFFLIGLLAAAIDLARHPQPRDRGAVVEAVLAWFLFFSIGVSFVYNAVFHIFFGDLAASYIGWENSPFQAEVGYASLGFAAVGFLAFRGGREVRFAAVLGPALFLWARGGRACAGHGPLAQLRPRQRRRDLLDRRPPAGLRAGADRAGAEA